VLRRHELAHGSAAEVIFLPAFLLQMERIFVLCMCFAIKARIQNETLRSQRNTWRKYLAGLWEDCLHELRLMLKGKRGKAVFSLQRSTSTMSRDWSQKTSQHLVDSQECIRRPLSSEEIYIALMTLRPELLDPRLNKMEAEKSMVRKLVKEHEGMIDMFAKTSHIFDTEELHNYIVTRQKVVEEAQTESVPASTSPSYNADGTSDAQWMECDSASGKWRASKPEKVGRPLFVQQDQPNLGDLDDEARFDSIGIQLRKKHTTSL